MSLSALLMPAIRSLMTTERPFDEQAGHAASSAVPRSVFTHVMSSLIDTRRSPLQSPTHASARPPAAAMKKAANKAARDLQACFLGGCSMVPLSTFRLLAHHGI